MWFENEYVQIYLIGCVAAFFFYIFRVTLFTALGWVTKANVIRNNLKKIQPPDTTSFSDKMAMYALLILFDVALSWISFAIGAWQTLAFLFNLAREVFSSTPEEIKLLRFPLKNNQNLPREGVWAYAVALNLKNGTEWNEGHLLNELNNIADDYPTFNKHSAIKTLEGLKVVNSDSIRLLADRVEIRFDD